MVSRSCLVVVACLSAEGCLRSDGGAPVCDARLAICEDDGSFVEDKADEPSVARVPWGSAIVVVGAPEPAQRVIDDLEVIRADAIGKEVVDRLEQAAATFGSVADGGLAELRLTLRARDEEDPDALQCARTLFDYGWVARANPTAWETDASGRVVVLTPGERVPPDRIRILYNRRYHESYEDGTPCFFPWMLLLHELLHAVHGMTGTVLSSIPDPSDPMPGGSNVEEARTIGRGAYLDDSPTENATRRLAGIPVRDSHGWLCGPR